MQRRSLAILSLLFAGALPLFAQTNAASTVSIRRTTAFNGPVLGWWLWAIGLFPAVACVADAVQ